MEPDGQTEIRGDNPAGMSGNTFMSALSSVSIRMPSLIFSSLYLDLFIVRSTPDMPHQKGFSISSLTASTLQ